MIPTGEGLRLVLTVAVVALVAAHIAVNIVCKWERETCCLIEQTNWIINLYTY